MPPVPEPVARPTTVDNKRLKVNQNEPTSPRTPLTGVVSIEWADAAAPDDKTQPPNFGWFGIKKSKVERLSSTHERHADGY
jgi:hypothetical protein